MEYYFSDINLATTEQLMKFIRMDQERQGDGFGNLFDFNCLWTTHYLGHALFSALTMDFCAHSK